MPEGMPRGSPSKAAGRGTTWTVTAQHVSAVLAASKRTMADRPTGGDGSPGRPKLSPKHISKTDRTSGGGSAQQTGDVRSPPSAESVRSSLIDTTRLGNQQRQGSVASLEEGNPTAAQHRPSVRASQPDAPRTGPSTEPAAGPRVAGRRPTSDRTLSTRGAAPPSAHGGGSHHAAGMRDAGPTSGAGAGSGYAGQHAAREAAAAAAARAELEAVTAELEAARGQLAEALRATQAERHRARDEREAAVRDMAQELDEHRTRLQVCVGAGFPCFGNGSEMLTSDACYKMSLHIWPAPRRGSAWRTQPVCSNRLCVQRKTIRTDTMLLTGGEGGGDAGHRRGARRRGVLRGGS